MQPKSGPATNCVRKEAANAAPVAALPLASAAFCCFLNAEALAKRGMNALQARVLIILLFAGLSGCVSGGGDDPRIHYVAFGAEQPRGNRVTVCHAYTCKVQTPYTFSRAEIASIAAVMAKVKRADTPYEERRAVAYAIAKIDTDVGNALGIKDRAGMQFTASAAIPRRWIASTWRPTPRAICSCSRRTA